ERGGEAIEIDRALSGQIAGMSRHGLRREAFELGSGMTGEPPQQAAQIFAAAFAEISQQRVELGRRQGRGGGEASIVAILPRQNGECDAAFAWRGPPPV